MAFQGTEGFFDWVSNLKFLPAPEPDSVRGKHLYPPLESEEAYKAPANAFEALEQKKRREGDTRQPGAQHIHACMNARRFVRIYVPHIQSSVGNVIASQPVFLQGLLLYITFWVVKQNITE